MTTRRAPRWFRLLVALHPREFRDRFGAEMEDAAVASLHHRGAGNPAEWWFLTRDLFTSALRQHIATRKSAAERPEPDERSITNGVRMNNLVQDLRYAIRSLSRVPGFTVTVIVSLALGIGANTLVYSLVDGLVLRPFPWPDAGRIVAVGVRYPDDSQRRFIETFSPAEFDDIRTNSRTLERFFAFDVGNRNISGGDFPERVFTAFLWGDPFATIGLRPHLGRGFTKDETTSDASSVAILSHRVWVNRFGRDSSIIGKAIQVNGVPRNVVGIMPASLLVMGTDLWLPMGMPTTRIPRQARQFAVIGRVRDGASMQAVQTDLATVAATVSSAQSAQFPEYRQWSLAASTWADVMSAPVRQSSLVMLGTVAFVLLLACANIASLMLTRASVRQRELALRAALGARVRRLARQLVTESLLLSLAGAGLGVAAAYLLIGPVTTLFPSRVSTLGMKPAISPAVLLVTLTLAVFVAVVTSVAPVARVARRGGLPGLVGAGRTRGGRGDRKVRQSFTVAQVAFALMLVSGATVMLRSMSRLNAITPGVDVDRLLTMRLSVPLERYKRSDIGPFFEMLSQRLTAIPGVRQAAAATQFPPMNGFDAEVVAEGALPSANRMIDVTNATEALPATLGLRVLSGRTFTATDAENAPRVAILNATAVRQFLGAGNALGRRVGLAVEKDTVWHEVVGVVSDARNRGLDAPTAPEMFVPVRQQAVAWNNQLFLIIRADRDPLRLLPAVREAIRSVDAQQPVYAVRTMRTAFADAVAPRRSATVLLAAFAGIAIVLAAVGIFGILSYLVSARTHEIGVRMALGAREGSVIGLVVRETAWLVGLGSAIGVAGIIALRGGISSVAFEVRAAEPSTMALALAVLIATALAAGLVPAWRAVRVHPIEALRTEA